MAESERWARVRAALEGSVADRPPFGFWMHFPEADRDPEALADATLELYRRYDMDYVKVMFRSSFGLEDWGCEFDGFHPSRGSWQEIGPVVRHPEDWRNLEELDPRKGALGEQLEVLGMVREGVGDEAPVLATLFAPTMLAARLAGRNLFLEHLREYPDFVRAGLQVVSSTVEAFGRACLGSGADGVFYAIELASRQLMPEDAYAELGAEYDRPVLESLHARSRVTMLHMHGQDLMFDLLASFPANVLNWYDRCPGPSLGEARTRTDKCLAGGIDHERTLMLDTPEEIGAEVRDAIRQVDGRGLMLAPGCGVPIIVPEASLQALSRARY